MKCRKEREVSFKGTTTFIPNTSHRCKRRTIDIESINATDILLQNPKEPDGLEGVTEEPRCGLSKDKEVCPRLSEDRRGNVFICLICHDMTNNTAGLRTELR